jgi:hypothetical protein
LIALRKRVVFVQSSVVKKCKLWWKRRNKMLT